MKKLLIGLLALGSLSVFAGIDCGVGPSIEKRVNILCVGDNIEYEGTVVRVIDLSDDFDKVELLDEEGKKVIRHITTSMKKVKH